MWTDGQDEAQSRFSQFCELCERAYKVVRAGGKDEDRFVAVPSSSCCNVICPVGILLPRARCAEILEHESVFNIPI